MMRQHDPEHRRIAIADAGRQLAAIVEDVERHGPVELTEHGESVVVIVSATEYRRLTEADRNTWAAYERFRATADLSDLDASIFDAVRDSSPGRDVSL